MISTQKLRSMILVRELRDLIQEIHDSGDCGHMLSDVLGMVNELCSKAYQLNLAELGDEQLASAGLMRKCVTDEMISRAMSVVIGSSGDYGICNEYLTKDSAREVLEAALSADEIINRDTAELRAKYHKLVEKYDKLAEKYHKLVDQVRGVPAVAAMGRREPATRITVQDVKQIANSVANSKCGSFVEWYDSEGRTLLNKLNAVREPVPEVAVPDALQKLRLEVAEAINILAMCGDKTPVDQLGKKLAAALKASAPSSNQQSEQGEEV